MSAEITIHSSFTGGNIEITGTSGDDIFLRNQIRDTMEDWFYWAFCVESAQGRTLTFHFDKKWIGYYGPAVSHDLNRWHWLGSVDSTSASDSFSYTFAPEESRVYLPDRYALPPGKVRGIL